MMTILVVLIILLGIVVLVQILRVNELLSEVKNQDANLVTDKDNQTQGLLFFLIAGITFLSLFVWQIKYWGIHILPPASSVHGATIDTLMNFTMGLIIFVFFLTQPLLTCFAYKYRGNSNRKAYFYHHNNKLELLWTVIPTLILTPVIIYGLNV
jgi:cytochrome c oxidase subunit 2